MAKLVAEVHKTTLQSTSGRGWLGADRTFLAADRTGWHLIVLHRGWLGVDRTFLAADRTGWQYPQKTYGWLGVDRTFLAADRTSWQLIVPKSYLIVPIWSAQMNQTM